MNPLKKKQQNKTIKQTYKQANKTKIKTKTEKQITKSTKQTFFFRSCRQSSC